MRHDENFIFKLFFNAAAAPIIIEKKNKIKKLKFSKSNFYYVMESFKIKIIMVHIFRLIVLFENGTKINVMIRTIMKTVRLVMRSGPQLFLIFHNEQDQPFINFCENVKMNIGNLMTVHSIFVVKKTTHVLILNQPYFLKTWFVQKYKKKQNV